MIFLLLGNVLYLTTERQANPHFNVIKAASGGENIFTLSGDGTLRLYKVSDYASETLLVYDHDLFVVSGKIVINW